MTPRFSGTLPSHIRYSRLYMVQPSSKPVVSSKCDVVSSPARSSKTRNNAFLHWFGRHRGIHIASATARLIGACETQSSSSNGIVRPLLVGSFLATKQDYTEFERVEHNENDFISSWIPTHLKNEERPIIKLGYTANGSTMTVVQRCSWSNACYHRLGVTLFCFSSLDWEAVDSEMVTHLPHNACPIMYMCKEYTCS